jgi:hypothetical protein
VTRLIAWLTGGGGLVAALALALFAFGAGSGYAARGLVDARAIATAELKAAQCAAGQAEARARSAEQAAAALNVSAIQVSAAMDALAAKAAVRAKANDQFVKEIADAPASDHICGGSAAELAFRRSMQPQP